MATEQNKEAQGLNVSEGGLESILKAVLSEARKPVIDEKLEARAERDKIRLREQRILSEQEKAAAEASCGHLREDNSSRVAWITNFNRSQGRYITEGFCQNCNKHFHKDQPEGETEFLRWTKIPTGSRMGV